MARRVSSVLVCVWGIVLLDGCCCAALTLFDSMNRDAEIEVSSMLGSKAPAQNRFAKHFNANRNSPFDDSEDADDLVVEQVDCGCMFSGAMDDSVAAALKDLEHPEDQSREEFDPDAEEFFVPPYVKPEDVDRIFEELDELSSFDGSQGAYDSTESFNDSEEQHKTLEEGVFNNPPDASLLEEIRRFDEAQAQAQAEEWNALNEAVEEILDDVLVDVFSEVQHLADLTELMESISPEALHASDPSTVSAGENPLECDACETAQVSQAAESTWNQAIPESTEEGRNEVHPTDGNFEGCAEGNQTEDDTTESEELGMPLPDSGSINKLGKERAAVEERAKETNANPVPSKPSLPSSFREMLRV